VRWGHLITEDKNAASPQTCCREAATSCIFAAKIFKQWKTKIKISEKTG